MFTERSRSVTPAGFDAIDFERLCNWFASWSFKIRRVDFQWA
jgi:hypothetical protein